ncbi:MAG: Mur ligase family protein, partial [Bacillota bacterium]|nr:Mur ligase family protein [Bacillota bacterium]
MSRGERQPHRKRMARLLDFLGHPQRDMPLFHVAGTNGKGSTAAFLASALQANGYRTFLFTSPHVERVEERFQRNGVPMDRNAFLSLFPEILRLGRQVAAQLGEMPTVFELFTALFYHWARQEKADVLVLETGLGGRLDPTTEGTLPLASLLTTVSLDHTDRLGPTRQAIAWEKAHIAKEGRPLVTAVDGDVAPVVKKVAAERGATVHMLDEEARWSSFLRAGTPLPVTHLAYEGPSWAFADLPLSLRGLHQGQNAALALLALEKAKHWLPSKEEAIQKGLQEAFLPCRLEAFSFPQGATVLLDGAHNEESAAALAAFLRLLPPRRRHVLLGAIAGKDLSRLVPPLAAGAATVTLTRPPHPKGLPP